jgi:serine/threonine-protein kinase
MEAQIITTVAGSGAYGGDATGGFSGDGGHATHAQLDNPVSVTTDNKGNFYIADDLNRRIRKVDTNGIITTIAGNGASGYSGDTGPATAAVFGEMGNIFVCNDTDLFLPDDINSRIRVVNLNNGIINTFAGSATAGYTGDGGPATLAELCTPLGISSDNDGNIY